MKRWIIILASFAVFLMLIFLLRYPILGGLGNYLIYEDEPQPAEIMFVLGGNAYDRGMEAAKLFKEGLANQVVCTSGLPPHDFKILGIDTVEAYLTKLQMMHHGVPDSKITVIRKGTSTKEESEIALNFCIENKIKSAIVLSNKFHTRRIKYFFEDKFDSAGIKLIILGAPYTQYNTDVWWESEYGLLDVNNEYVKLLYYMIN